MVVSLDSVYEYERAISENAHGTLLMHNTRSYQRIFRLEMRQLIDSKRQHRKA